MLLEANTASARISNQTRGAELGLAGSNSSAAATNCRFKTPAFRDSTTTALASYPGSGSTVTRMLLELASGVLTGSVYKDPSLFHGKPYAYRGELTTQKVIAIKTHGPWKRHNMLSAAKRAVVLVRNPRQAIPSYFNWEWGDQHRNQHGVQAPEKGWVAWRNMKFNAELQEWKRFLSHWAGRHAHFILYEDIVDDVRGPKVLGSALAYLGEKVSPAHVQCTWTDVVHSRSRGVHRRKTYTPGYTPAQECALSRELWALARDRTYASHPVLGPALRSWAAAASCAPPPAHYKASPPPRLP